MTASATDLEKMMSEKLQDASVFIAVTDDDCVNICAAQLARNVFHIPKVVARIYDEEKIDLVKNMEIDTICPSELSEKEISNYIAAGGMRHVG